VEVRRPRRQITQARNFELGDIGAFARIASRMSTVRMKQISSGEFGDAACVLGAKFQAAGWPSEGEIRNGAAAAEMAALVPSLRASRRVIPLLIRFPLS
jgi:hypothetical protein